MNEKIKKIIAELYELDPDLKKYETKLVSIIENFLESKPDTKFDLEFAKNLKVKILTEPMPVAKTAPGFFLSFINMKKNYLIMSGAALAVLVIAVTAKQTLPMFKTSERLSSGGAKVTRVAAGAFGALSAGSNGQASPQNAASEGVASKDASAVAPVAFGRGGGGGADAVTGSSGTATANAVMAISSPSAKMMIYRPYTIKYVYKGEALELKDKTLDVVRRVKPEINTSEAVSALNKLSFGGINLGSFSSSKVTIFELAQSDSTGYIANVDLRNGSISISQNYFNNPCPKGVCPVYQPLRPSDMLSDESLIALSNSFLKEHGVSLSNYGEPVVQNDWRKNLETTSPSFAPYVPDVISVLYPQKVNNTEVYELGGGLSGLTVNVDVRSKKVSGAWNIVNQDYEASSYEAETDTARIVKIAENGGIYGAGYIDPSAEIIEVELGTPKRIYANVWKSDGSGEVVVPALYFPVVKAPASSQYYVQNSIVVPLVKELLQVPEPGPIQLMKESVPAVTPAAPAEVKGL